MKREAIELTCDGCKATARHLATDAPPAGRDGCGGVEGVAGVSAPHSGATPTEFCRHEESDPLCLRSRPGIAPEITAERPSGVDAGDRAREAVADLLSLRTAETSRLMQGFADDRRAAEERALIEAYERGVRAGRHEAADDLAAWAERVEPIQPGAMPSRVRRVLARAVQVVAPEPTMAEMAAALVEVLEGLAPGCVLRGEPTGGEGRD